jgi:PhnB protein
MGQHPLLLPSTGSLESVIWPPMNDPSPSSNRFQKVGPGLNFGDCAGAIEFLKAAFDAEELFRLPCPSGSGKILHGEIKIGGSILSVCDESPDWGAVSPKTSGGCPFSLNITSDDCDAAHDQAVAAGATSLSPPTDYPWGERSCTLVDPSGYRWMIAQHIEDVSPEELSERLKHFPPA